jgi:hypothetical protein
MRAGRIALDQRWHIAPFFSDCSWLRRYVGNTVEVDGAKRAGVNGSVQEDEPLG